MKIMKAIELIIKNDNKYYFNTIKKYIDLDFYNKLNLYTKCFQYKDINVSNIY